MSGAVLTEDQIYDGADVQDRSRISLEDIKHIQISLQPFRDLTALEACTSLKIVVLRLCGFKEFPASLLKIASLEGIDLTGNQIERLPDSPAYENLTRLRSLNLCDNQINDIKEIDKLAVIKSLKNLNLTGNVCMSAHDSFNRISRAFENLVVLSDNIITSQHRGYLIGVAGYNSEAIVPYAKIDDFYFLYVKYMHASALERYTRRANADFFCLNRVIRKYSVAERIQSRVRGLACRLAYKKMLNAAIFLRDFIKFWYYKRMKAANKIQMAWLRYRMKQAIKRVVSARKIQCAWRKWKARQETLMTVFLVDGRIEFFASEPAVAQLQTYIEDRGLVVPKIVGSSPYRLIRTGSSDSRKQKLPGSPVIFYFLDDSVLIRAGTKKEANGKSLWCGHDHNTLERQQRVSKDGVNWAKPCIMEYVKFKREKSRKYPVLGFPEYPSLVKCQYDRAEDFSPVIQALVRDNPEGIILFTEASLKAASSHIIVQSSCRCFLTRHKFFRKAKREVIENRAAQMIQNFVRLTRFRKAIMLSTKVLAYYKMLPDVATFYISRRLLENLTSKQPNNGLEFGFSVDRTVLLAPGQEGILTKMLPVGKIMYNMYDMSSLFKVGTVISPAQAGMFDDSIPSKWIRRNRIMRVTFPSMEEAHRRLALYAFMSGDFTSVLPDYKVLEYCAACSITNAWIGFSTRKLVTHMGAQLGRKLNLSCLVMHRVAEKKVIIPKSTNVSTKRFNTHMIQEQDRTTKSAIAELRNDYQPWAREVEKYRERNPYGDVAKQSQKQECLPEEVSDDMKAMGLIGSLENAFQNKTSDSPPMHPTPNVIQSATMGKKRVTFRNVKRPLVATLRFPKKERRLVFETESEKIFGPRLTDIKPRAATSLCKEPKKPLRPLTPVTPESEEQMLLTGRVTSQEEIYLSENWTVDEPKVLYQQTQNSRLTNRLLSSATLRSREPRPLFEEPVTPMTRTVKSPQKSDHTMEMLVQAAFTKLVRLRQLGDEVEHEAVVDNTIEEKRQKARAARETLDDMRKELNERRERELGEAKARNAVEAFELEKRRTEITTRNVKSRNERASRTRNSHIATMEKMKNERTFAVSFVSMSRQIASKSEKIHRDAEKARKFAGIVAAKAETKNDLLNSKKNYREKVEAIKREKLETSEFDRMLLEKRRERMMEAAEERIMTAHGLRAERLKRARSSQTTLKKPFIKKLNEPVPIEDVRESAARALSSLMKTDLGTVESHMIADLLAEILENV